VEERGTVEGAEGVVQVMVEEGEGGREGEVEEKVAPCDHVRRCEPTTFCSRDKQNCRQLGMGGSYMH
jgi:hypothetical protein